MKRRAPAPLKTMLLLCALAPMTLARCGGSANDGGGIGTETGNPPAIDKAALRLEVTPDGVRLVGTPGAVTPGAEVRITNQRTGTSAATTAAANGSVELTISGEPRDVYEITVTRGGREVTITLTTADLPADLSSLSCDALGDALGNVMAATYAEADTSCTVDADCAETSWGGDCYFGCGASVLSGSAVDATAALGEQRIAGLCDEIEARSCGYPEPSCDRPELVLRCEQGQCVARAPGELTCNEQSSAAADRLATMRADTPLECTDDSECGLQRYSLSCVPDCGYEEAIAVRFRSLVDDTLLSIEQRICQPSRAGGCPPPLGPDCPAPDQPTVAVCMQGQCAVRYGEP